METKALKPPVLKHVNVDTTVHEKAIAFPTDARLYHYSIIKCESRWCAKRTNALLCYAKVLRRWVKKLSVMQGCYASIK